MLNLLLCIWVNDMTITRIKLITCKQNSRWILLEILVHSNRFKLQRVQPCLFDPKFESSGLQAMMDIAVNAEAPANGRNNRDYIQSFAWYESLYITYGSENFSQRMKVKMNLDDRFYEIRVVKIRDWCLHSQVSHNRGEQQETLIMSVSFLLHVHKYIIFEMACNFNTYTHKWTCIIIIPHVCAQNWKHMPAALLSDNAVYLSDFLSPFLPHTPTQRDNSI